MTAYAVVRCVKRRGVDSVFEALEGLFHEGQEVFVLFVRVVLVQAVSELFRVERGEGSQEAVPDGEDGPVIGVCVGLFPVVVDFMHVGGYQYPADGLVELPRQADVGMCEAGDGDEEGLKDHDGVDGGAGSQDAEEEEESAPDTLQGMVPEAGGDIDVVVGMVDQVEPPEEGYLVFDVVA